MGAVVADARQVEVVAVRVFAAADILVPVRALAGVVVLRSQWCVGVAAEGNFMVVEIPRLAKLVDAGAVAGLGHAILEAAAHALVAMWRAGAGLRADRIPQHVRHAVALGPQALAGHGTGLAAEAFVEVHHHCDLSFAHDDSRSIKVAQRLTTFSSPLVGRRRGCAKHASRRRSRSAVQSRPWGAERGLGERG